MFTKRVRTHSNTRVCWSGFQAERNLVCPHTRVGVAEVIDQLQHPADQVATLSLAPLHSLRPYQFYAKGGWIVVWGGCCGGPIPKPGGHSLELGVGHLPYCCLRKNPSVLHLNNTTTGARLSAHYGPSPPCLPC